MAAITSLLTETWLHFPADKISAALVIAINTVVLGEAIVSSLSITCADNEVFTTATYANTACFSQFPPFGLNLFIVNCLLSVGVILPLYLWTQLYSTKIEEKVKVFEASREQYVTDVGRQDEDCNKSQTCSLHFSSLSSFLSPSSFPIKEGTPKSHYTWLRETKFTVAPVSTKKLMPCPPNRP